MTDDLVKRLRETTHMYQVDCELKMKCADRIEELEAKLAKAVEALQWLKVEIRGHGFSDEGRMLTMCISTLAELTGGKDG
jgi:hypothetical protein